MNGVKKLLKLGNGSPSAVAAKLSQPDRECTRQLVQYWEKQGYVTPQWAPRVNAVYGVPLHELNPTVYPKSFAA